MIHSGISSNSIKSIYEDQQGVLWIGTEFKGLNRLDVETGKFYSYDDIRELIEYARKKHISVIPEIDMPGHSDSFVKSMGVKMESMEGMKTLENILNEFFSRNTENGLPNHPYRL